MQVIIKQISFENKVSQNSGKAFESCKILTTNSQGRDVWLSGFGSPISHTWESGDTVEVDLEQRGNYWNFKENANSKPSPDKKLELLKQIDKKLDFLMGVKTEARPIDTEIKSEDLPF